jgi:hypothetical protein
MIEKDIALGDVARWSTFRKLGVNDIIALCSGPQENAVIDSTRENFGTATSVNGCPMDFVDWMFSKLNISSTILQEFALTAEFIAAICAYRSSTANVSLGEAGVFCWPVVAALHSDISEEDSLNYLRIGSYCSELPRGDGRSIIIDLALAREQFPRLFSRKQENRDPPNGDKLGAFAAKHEFRSSFSSNVKLSDENNYIEYWISSARSQIDKYLTNEKFVAGLFALNEEILSFHGFLERVFGADFYESVLQKNGYALFQGLRSDLTGRVLIAIAAQVHSAQSSLESEMRVKYPELYEPYQPELYGSQY